MPKRPKEPSALEIKRLGMGVHAIGRVAGLALQVTGSDAKSWLLRVRVGDKRREIGLGPYPEVSFAKARDGTAEAKEMIRDGIDPIEQRKVARSVLIAEQKTRSSNVEIV